MGTPSENVKFDDGSPATALLASTPSGTDQKSAARLNGRLRSTLNASEKIELDQLRAKYQVSRPTGPVPTSSLIFDDGTTGADLLAGKVVPTSSLQFDSEPVAAVAEPRPFSMEGVSGDMEGTGEASQAVAAVATGLNPLAPVVSGLAGAAGAVAGAPWREGAETADRWMKAVSPYTAVPLPQTKAAEMLASVPDAAMTTIRNLGTGKRLQFASKDSWAVKWTNETWGDRVLAYTDSSTFAAAADTLGEFAAFLLLAKAAKGLTKKGEPVTRATVDPIITQATLDAPKMLTQGHRVDIAGKEYVVIRVGKQGTDLVDAKTKEVFTVPPGEKIKAADGTFEAADFDQAKGLPRKDLPEYDGPVEDVSPQLYHGTGAEFDQFDPAKSSYDNLFGPGLTFMTENPERAGTYAVQGEKPNIRPVSVDMKNPIDMDKPADPRLVDMYVKERAAAEGPAVWSVKGESAADAAFSEERRKAFVASAEASVRADLKSNGALTNMKLVRLINDQLGGSLPKRLESLGYDGITHMGGEIRGEVVPGDITHRVYASWDPASQIKSWFDAETERHFPMLPDEALSPEHPTPKKALAGEEAAPLDTSILGNESGQAKILNDTAAGVLRAGEELERVFTPASVSEISEKTAGSIREHNAAEALIKERISARYEKSAESFETLSEADHLKFIDAAENGKSTGYTAVDAVFADLRRMREKLWKRIQDAKGTDHFIENYFPHFWEDPTGAARVFGTRPLAGPATFFKERTIPTVADGYANGLKLIDTNPVRLEVLKMHEMLRWLKGQEIFEELKTSGHAEFVPYSKAPPEGFSKINDKIARVPFKGEWYAHADAAAVLNNYLSPGLSGRSAIFDGMRNVGNLMNNVQLGMSLFHMTFTALDATIGRFSLGLQEVLRGQGVDGGIHIASSFVPGLPVLQTIIKGNKAMKGLLAADQVFAQFATQLVEGGSRVKMGAFYKNSSIGKFWEALGQKDYISSGAHAIPAMIQYLARPMMEKWVPSMKLGMYMDMVESQNKFWTKHGVNPTKEMRRKAYGKMTDAVDDRMGQMIYDNLFWHKTLKDVLMVSTRSLGWNLGTIRHILGGAKDILDIKVDKAGMHISARTAYLVGLPAITALYSAMYQYMRTGKGPESLMDLRLPRTGKTTIDGREERISLPTYLKDVYSYKEHPVTTIGHKIHPLLSMLNSLFITGQDYYGVTIRNGEDPLMKQVADVSRFVGKSFIPFSVSGVLKRRESGASVGEQVEAFFGLLPAPKALTQTPAEKVADVVAAKHRESGPTTREEFLHGQAKADLLHGVANKTADFSDLIQEAFDQGIQGGELINIIRNASKPHMVVALIKATPREAMGVWKVANDEERAELYQVIIRKLVSNKALPPQDRVLFMQQLQEGR